MIDAISECHMVMIGIDHGSITMVMIMILCILDHDGVDYEAADGSNHELRA